MMITGAGLRRQPSSLVSCATAPIKSPIQCDISLTQAGLSFRQAFGPTFYGNVDNTLLLNQVSTHQIITLSSSDQRNG